MNTALELAFGDDVGDWIAVELAGFAEMVRNYFNVLGAAMGLRAFLVDQRADEWLEAFVDRQVLASPPDGVETDQQVVAEIMRPLAQLDGDDAWIGHHAQAVHNAGSVE